MFGNQITICYLSSKAIAGAIALWLGLYYPNPIVIPLSIWALIPM